MTHPLRLGKLEALMLDIDGVLLTDGEPISGAVRSTHALLELGIDLRFVTNTTAVPRARLLARLRDLGFPVSPHTLFTVAALARRMFEREHRTRYRLLGPPGLEADLGDGRIELHDPSTPDWVVMGLHPPVFQHDSLNIGLRDLLRGARLVALHANRVWRTRRGMELGLGAYVRALEYASRTEAKVMGKPSRAFFQEVIDDLNLPLESVAMVGDDTESDVAGALNAGIHGIQVKTGKYTDRSLALSGTKPSLVVEDINDLATRLEAARH